MTLTVSWQLHSWPQLATAASCQALWAADAAWPLVSTATTTTTTTTTTAAATSF